MKAVAVLAKLNELRHDAEDDKTDLDLSRHPSRVLFRIVSDEPRPSIRGRSGGPGIMTKRSARAEFGPRHVCVLFRVTDGEEAVLE